MPVALSSVFLRLHVAVGANLYFSNEGRSPKVVEKKYITVTALTRYIKRKFDVDPHLQDVWIKGEISNFTFHSRGHMYFTLKDQNARIQAIMFSSYNKSLTFTPENGMNVLLRGEIQVYEPNGAYQIYVKEMQPDGIGNLYLAFEELKKRLEKEGLFAATNKKAIPKFPKNIGVITSPTGAAIRDILTTIKRRYPIAKVTLIPALVQGNLSAPSIVQAIKLAHSLILDVLIVGRGGGSIEELWAFNEEIVAREIFQSKIPIISAVGHETDFTIADFVADLRAPTPTGAAELAVPNIIDLNENVSLRKARLIRVTKEKVALEKKKLQSVQKSYAFKYPQKLYEQKEQQLDRLMDMLSKESQRAIERKATHYKQLTFWLKKNHPEEQLKKAVEKQQFIVKTLQKEMQSILKRHQTTFASAISNLKALSPLKIMERGYSLVYDEKKQLMKSVKQVQPGDTLKIQLEDGKLDCQVWGIEERMNDD
jgi:exodeoxyribonuclease VII large subunit